MRTDPAADRRAAQAIDAYVVNEDAELLLMRRSFSQRRDPGVWTTSLHGHGDADEDPVETARRLALCVLGMRLQDVTVVVPHTRLLAPGCAQEEPEPGSILVARASRRVVTPDPTRFDDASWMRWDSDLHLSVAGHGVGAAFVPDEVRSAVVAMTRTQGMTRPRATDRTIDVRDRPGPGRSQSGSGWAPSLAPPS